MKCKHCGKFIKKARGRDEAYMHVESKLWYCWKNDKINESEFAEPE